MESCISTGSGTAWAVPGYDSNGNSTVFPKPASPATPFAGAFDAWNRLAAFSSSSASSTLYNYRYDGLNRRVQKIASSSPTSIYRDYYYSNAWQVLEERMGPANNCVERQFVWGLRYPDDLVLRDRDTTGGSSSATCAGVNERLYVLHDYFHPTAVINTSGTVEERYGHNAYGGVNFMNSSFGSISASAYGWETLYGAYRWDGESGLYQARNRYLHPGLGSWLSRDPLDYISGNNLYGYVRGNPINQVDPLGLDGDSSSQAPSSTTTSSSCNSSTNSIAGLQFDLGLDCLGNRFNPSNQPSPTQTPPGNTNPNPDPNNNNNSNPNLTPPPTTSGMPPLNVTGMDNQINGGTTSSGALTNSIPGVGTVAAGVANTAAANGDNTTTATASTTVPISGDATGGNGNVSATAGASGNPNSGATTVNGGMVVTAPGMTVAASASGQVEPVLGQVSATVVITIPIAPGINLTLTGTGSTSGSGRGTIGIGGNLP